MNGNKLTFLKSILLCAGVLTSAFAVADMTGTWNLTVETAQGAGNPSFTLVEEDGKLSGTYTGMMGSTPVSGTIANDTFKLTFTVEAQGTSMTVDYGGTVSDDSIEGKLNMAEFASGTFTGKKQ